MAAQAVPPVPQPVPVIVRIAGVSATAVTGAGGPDLPAQMAAIARVLRQLEALRGSAVEALYERLHRADAAERRLLLALKRDCFNGRPIGRHREAEAWPRVAEGIGGALLERVVALETAVERLDEELIRAYGEALEHERRRWLAHAGDRRLLRGISLASPDLLAGLERYRPFARGSRGRKARRAANSFLRYLSRAAVKLSPYSTLTPVALAQARPVEAAGLHFMPGPRSERSLVRIKRYLLDQCLNLLLLHPPVLRHLSLALNSSLEPLADGEFRFLLPLHLVAEEREGGGRRLAYARQGQVKARLTGALIPALLERLEGSAEPYQPLVRDLAERFGDGREDYRLRVERLLRRLLEMGFLAVEPPWAGYEPHLEANLLSFLDALPPGTVPLAILTPLRELVDLERGFSGLADPSGAVARFDELTGRLFEAIKAESIPGVELGYERARGWNYYEDLFVASEAAAGPPVVRLDRGGIDRALEAGTLLWRAGSLFEPRHEFRLALGRHLAESFPGRSRVPFLEVFSESRPLFQQMLVHLGEERRTPFDPYDLPAVAELERLRSAVRDRLTSAVESDDLADRFSCRDLREALKPVPERLLPAVGPCLFLQPADAGARSWVLNRVFEGTGRMSSRFNVLLDDGSREGFLGHYRERSVVRHDGRDLELLDMLYTKADTVNAHWPQTEKVLVIPGESCGLPPERRLRLSDLFLELRGKELDLVDAGGRAYLPCFMGSLHTPFMPAVLKFLDLFGVFCRGRFELPGEPVRGDRRLTYRRQVIGELIVRRRRWVLSRAALPETAAEGSRAWAEIWRWREAAGLPEQVYLVEPVNGRNRGVVTYKPQYIDFRSPSFVALFQDSIGRLETSAILVEALPRPEEFPHDPELGARGVEIVAEALAFEPPSSAALGRPASAAVAAAGLRIANPIRSRVAP
jgi:hypothetical protein